MRAISRPTSSPKRRDAIVIDVSFISLMLALPRALAMAAPGAWLVALVKPQFEVGRAHIGKGGIVRDPAAGLAAAERVAEWLAGSRWLAGAWTDRKSDRSAATAIANICWRRQDHEHTLPPFRPLRRLPVAGCPARRISRPQARSPSSMRSTASRHRRPRWRRSSRSRRTAAAAPRFKAAKTNGETRLGFHARQSHDIVDMQECRLLDAHAVRRRRAAARDDGRAACARAKRPSCMSPTPIPGSTSRSIGGAQSNRRWSPNSRAGRAN